MTLIDLIEHLLNQEKVDELTLIELLDISPEDILERFSDRVEEQFEFILDYLGLEEEEEQDENIT
jgi:hypothetical protein